MSMISNVQPPKTPKTFLCELCDFKSSNKKDFSRHLATQKHIINDSQCFSTIISQKNSKNPLLQYKCKCGKKYKDNSGLWRHKKKCPICINLMNSMNLMSQCSYETHKPALELAPELIKLITELVKGQNGLQETILEFCKNGAHQNTTTNYTTNSFNKTFNLQFFLNETCKDAMNIMDFVDSIKVQLSDLEKVGKLGYVDGISNIIVNNLKALDVTQRPVHCTDKKRETLYIKDENKWEKEDENQLMMHKVIKKVANKNARMLPKFKEAHPDCIKSTSFFSDQYNKIIIESMGGHGENEFEKEKKIINKISKEVVVDKPKPL
jgi:hypothetical protein